MSYRIVKFGTVDLPELDPEDDLSTHEARSRLVLTPGGWFDAAGSGRAGVNPLPLRVRKTIISDGVPATAQALTMTDFMALRALVDTRDRLWREWPDGTLEWTYARLLQVPVRADRKDNRNQVEMELAFQIVSDAWFGTSNGIADGAYLNYIFLTPSSFTAGGIINAGNAPATNLLIIVDPDATPITHLRLRNLTTGHDLTWTGTIAAGTTLQIDCGAKQILNNGVAAYNGLTEPSTAGWFELAPGSNTVGVDITGGAYTSGVFFVFYPPWR
jgi:hypothetical protein